MRALEKIIALTKRIEQPEHPLLGPNINGLYVVGLLRTGNRFRNICYNIILVIASLCLTSQFYEIWVIRGNFMEAQNSLSVAALGATCTIKAIFFVYWEKHWRRLVKGVSEEEIRANKEEDAVVLNRMEEYTKYVRFVTIFYWFLVFLSNIMLITSPFLRYLIEPKFRESVKIKEESYPQVLNAWFPFDKTSMPGYLAAMFIQTLHVIYGGGVIAAYDTNAVAIMSFLKGQLVILREKCMRIIDENETVSNVVIVDRMKECHRHHNFLIKQTSLFNSLLSPVMFTYVLICSIMICSGVVQLSSDKPNTFQKVWVVEYTVALMSQLFLYCWHSNEVIVESRNLDRGVYASSWWKTDNKTRKLITLLAAKLTLPFALHAGPFANLSVPTFIEIMKGSYSFFTLLTKMQEGKND